MTTPRALRDEVQNVLDYLVQAELALYANPVSITGNKVSWHAFDPSQPFITGRRRADADQYMVWAGAGAYSALLYDGSLLQISYDVVGGAISGHRLAYVPCPFPLDLALLDEAPLLDVLDLYQEADPGSMLMLSPLRFDFDPRAAAPGHPSAHLTVNTSDCRVACVAPMHVHRFVDFVFRQFYPSLRRAHATFFETGALRQAGKRVLAEDDGVHPHLMWPVS